MSDKFEERFKRADAYYNSKNYELAFKIFLKLAEEGDDNSMDRIGSMYDSGEGVEYNLEQAIYWYEKALEKGCLNSRHNLGVTYRRHGDMLKAKYWFEESIKHGNLDSALDLAKLLMVCEDKKDQVVFYLKLCSEDKNGYEDTISEANELLVTLDRRKNSK